MILAPIPLHYQPLTKRGDWRLSVYWCQEPGWWRRSQRFREGTVRTVRVAWVLIRLMVKA